MTPDDQRRGQRGHQPAELAQARRFRKILVARESCRACPSLLPSFASRSAPEPGERLDKALAAAVPEALALSRSRLQALIAEGAVARGGRHARWTTRG